MNTETGSDPPAPRENPPTAGAAGRTQKRPPGRAALWIGTAVIAGAAGALGSVAGMRWEEQRKAAEIQAAKASPLGIQRDVVQRRLNDPESAQFRDERQAKSGLWCGKVNAKNRMGGYVGFSRYIATIDQDRKSAVDWVDFEPTEDKTLERLQFDRQWERDCR